MYRDKYTLKNRVMHFSDLVFPADSVAFLNPKYFPSLFLKNGLNFSGRKTKKIDCSFAFT